MPGHGAALVDVGRTIGVFSFGPWCDLVFLAQAVRGLFRRTGRVERGASLLCGVCLSFTLDWGRGVSSRVERV